MGFASDMNKVLWVTPFFPPSINVATVRTIKFLKYLPRFGWEAAVVCPSTTVDHTVASTQLLSQLSNSIRTFPKSRDVFNDLVARKDNDRGARYLSYIMNNVIPPDGHFYWALSSLFQVESVVNEYRPDLVFTTCNPYSINLVGAWVKYKFQIPWVTEFRDLWTLNQQPRRFMNAYHQWVSRKLERYYLTRCDRLIVTTQNSKKRMTKLYPMLNDKADVICNGFDIQDIQSRRQNNPIPNSFFFSGSIVENTKYNPLPVLSVLKKLQDDDISNTAWQFHYAGTEGESFIDLVRQSGIRVKCQTHGYLDHERYYALIQKMAYIIICLPREVDCRSWIPSRLYDYMGNNARIICLAPRNSEVFNLLKAYNNCLSLYYEEPEPVQTQKLRSYLSSKEQHVKIPASFLNSFSREHLAMRLTEVFQNAINFNIS
jgi:glycosyltransferase involved in cell wall biosynthesis